MSVLVDAWYFSLLFIALGWTLLFLEMFVPGGLLGAVAVTSIGLGIYGFYNQERFVLAAVAVVGSVLYGVWLLRVVLERVRMRGTLDPESSTSVDPGIAGLIGKQGLSKSPLRPAGLAIIDGKRIDVVTRGQFIAKDQPIEVVETLGNRVVVRALSTPEETEE